MNPKMGTSLIGVLCTAAGAAAAAVIYWHPERLRVPAWVGYAACLTFVLAGLSLVAQSVSRQGAARALGAACMAALVLTAVWVAFGPGERACSASIAWLGWLATEFVCRGVFGFGALLGAAVLGWVLVQALRGQDVA